MVAATTDYRSGVAAMPKHVRMFICAVTGVFLARMILRAHWDKWDWIICIALSFGFIWLTDSMEDKKRG